uniref:Odorant-binding protein n=1 Tax=Anoplophora chinensis TaxID=217632 RepID=A0A2H4ZB50_ANOCN|nr:odorant-binding protein [Anoplophora chinensis]
MWRKYFLASILTCLLSVYQVGSLTEKQVQATVKMVRNTCQSKTKASTDDIEKMHLGDWNIDREAMCYMQCALNMHKLLNKENKFDYESGMNQLKILPESFRGHTLECMNQCKDAVVTPRDKCIAAYEFAKCFYFCNPEKYFLP